VNEHGRSSSRLVLTAVAAGLVLRLAFGLGYWVSKPLTHDEREYLTLAANVWQGRGFSQTLPEEPAASVQQFGRAPFYPLALAPFTAFDADLSAGRMPADVPTAIKIVQSLIGAGAVWLIAAIAGRMAGPRAATAAAVIAAAYPPLVWICAYALSEAVYATLALAGVWCLGRVTDGAWSFAPHPNPLPASGERGKNQNSDSWPRGFSPGVGAGPLTTVAAAGALAGLAALTRPAHLFFLPLAALLLVRRSKTGTGLPRAATFCVAALLVIAPWTMRNVSSYGRFVLIASEGGVTFWTGNHREARGEGDLAANPQLKALNAAFREGHPGLSEEALEPLYYREAFGFIAEDPLRWAGLLARKAWFTIVPLGPSYRLHSARYFYASLVSYGLVLALALAAWARVPRDTRPWSLLALATSAVLVCLVFLPQERFRIPVIDPTLIVIASALATRQKTDPAVVA
jgi:4-amino-4-deoxy-L-arabinose transferase-like glycosyltransferase